MAMHEPEEKNQIHIVRCIHSNSEKAAFHVYCMFLCQFTRLYSSPGFNFAPSDLKWFSSWSQWHCKVTLARMLDAVIGASTYHV